MSLSFYAEEIIQIFLFTFLSQILEIHLQFFLSSSKEKIGDKNDLTLKFVMDFIKI